MKHDWLIDMILGLSYLLAAVAVGLLAWSMVRGLMLRDKSAATANGIPVSKIAWGTAALLAVSMLLTFLLGSSEPLIVNGKSYSDSFWLKASDMFVYTTVILIIAAVLGIVFAKSGLNRRLK